MDFSLGIILSLTYGSALPPNHVNTTKPLVQAMISADRLFSATFDLSLYSRCSVDKTSPVIQGINQSERILVEKYAVNKLCIATGKQLFGFRACTGTFISRHKSKYPQKVKCNGEAFLA